MNALEQINDLVGANRSTAQKQPTADQLRKAAMQFEAVLLQQLTSALSKTTEDEDSLFGSDGGTGLAKQMFSEQLATTMAQSGGVGLADMIMRQFGVAPAKPSPARNGLANAATTVMEIKQNAAREDSTPVKVPAVIYKSGRIEPVNMNPTGSDEVEIISTFEGQVRTEGIDESLVPLILDGKIMNSTRPRIAPNAPVTQLKPVSSVTPTVETMTSPAISANVTYQLPATGRISSDFGTRFHPIDKKTKFHGGIDIAIPTGTKVVAAADGIVKFSGWKGGYGNVVVIEHRDGSETLYAHNSKLLVAAGQKVNGGDPITLSGSTGKSTGPHLHFEIRRNGKLVNPADFLSNVLTKPAER